jgi:hypothetical protein
MAIQKQLITFTQNGLSVHIEGTISSTREDVLFLPNVAFYEPKSVTNSGGMSTRMWKGFWLRSSQSKSHAELTMIDEGFLSISHKDILFGGRLSTISIPIKQIIRVQHFSDGIAVYKEGRQKGYTFVWGNSADMKLVNVKNENENIRPLHGSPVGNLINGLVANANK